MRLAAPPGPAVELAIFLRPPSRYKGKGMEGRARKGVEIVERGGRRASNGRDGVGRKTKGKRGMGMGGRVRGGKQRK